MILLHEMAYYNAMVSIAFLQSQSFFLFSLLCPEVGKAGSTPSGNFPVKRALKYPIAIDKLPHVKPTTTPASTMFLHGYGSRLTKATITATPVVTLQLTIILLRVAWNNPMEYAGANIT